MTKEDIIRMAREAGFDVYEALEEIDGGFDAAERFAALVAATEREAIIQAMPGGHSVDPQWVCDAIRARGSP